MNRARKGGRRGSDWVAEAHQDEGPGRCVICGCPRPPRRSVLCARKPCRTTYETISRGEARAKAKAARETP